MVMGDDSCLESLWVQIPAPYTGWRWYFHTDLPLKLCCLLEKTENKRKRDWGWPIFYKWDLTTKPKFVIGDGLVVSALDFYSNDPSSNPAQDYIFVCITRCLKRTNTKQNRGWGWCICKNHPHVI